MLNICRVRKNYLFYLSTVLSYEYSKY